MTFSAGFIWGAATAAYQIEGAVTADGRGASIWDVFSHLPGKTRNGDTGDTATDHYHRMSQDVALLDELGLRAYRFSVSWPRVQPAGSGPANQPGVDFYSRLVDELLAHGIEPFVTLYHWDLPQALEDEGGWDNRDTSSRFAEYADIVGRSLGDRAHTFTTLNEPWCSAFLGYASGAHAPGRSDLATSLRAAHHLNLAHGLGAQALKGVIRPDAHVSITLNLAHLYPASDSAADFEAVRSVDAVANRIFLEPILQRHYPDDLIADTAHITDWSFVQPDDLGAIAATGLDVLGVNFYNAHLIAARTPEIDAHLLSSTVDSQDSEAPAIWPGSDSACSMPQPGPHTAMNWPIQPDALTELLLRVHRDFPDLPMVITENGAAFTDDEGVDGIVHDADRIAYLDAHIRAVSDAISAGVDIRGYFVWSLMDNFEWAWGYSKRFGIVHVDYATLIRTPKDSARWYKSFITDQSRSDR